MALLSAGLLTTACTKAPSWPLPEPAYAALGLGRIKVGPVHYATNQPDEACSPFVDEELRSALVLELGRHGYQAAAVGNAVARTFAPGLPAPLPGAPVPDGLLPPAFEEGLLLAWIDEFWENNQCGGDGPKYLTMGVTGVLYAGSPPHEVWRGRARIDEHGNYLARDLIWLATARLADQLLATLPGGPKRTSP